MVFIKAAPGVLYADCRQESPIEELAAWLDKSDLAYRSLSRPPGFAVFECNVDTTASDYPARLLERVTGASCFADRRIGMAGLLYGPIRSAAWRVLDAKHFGSAEQRRATYIVVTSDVDPAFLFEQSGGRPDNIAATLVTESNQPAT